MTETENSDGDSAWATVVVPMQAAALIEFCQDVERLIKINPMLYLEAWSDEGDGHHRMRGRNTSQQPGFEFDIGLRGERRDDGVEIFYAEGLKTTTRVQVEARGQEATLTIIEDYSGTDEEERRARINEVDKSLVPWAAALLEFLLRWKRWSRFPPWRWYMKWVWLRMNPSGRRITYMLLWVTFAEIMAFLLVFIIFWFDFNKFFEQL